jgi:hypothetical protein
MNGEKAMETHCCAKFANPVQSWYMATITKKHVLEGENYYTNTQKTSRLNSGKGLKDEFLSFGNFILETVSKLDFGMVDDQLSISSMYQALLDTNTIPYNTYHWKLKIALKIRVFLWLLYRGEILNKDNLVKRNYHRNVMCCFCNNYETIHHLFLIVLLLSLCGESSI